MPDHILKTKNLFLRPITRNDAGLLWPYVSDRDIPKDMSWEAHKDIKETEEFIGSTLKSMSEGRTITWCIFYKEDFCGIISLISILRTHRSLIYNKAEIAYWLGPDFQGNGIMLEAGKKVIEYAFEVLDLNKIVVGHHINNEKSKNLILRLGFKFTYEEEDVFKKDGKWISCRFYEFKSKDYIKQ